MNTGRRRTHPGFWTGSLGLTVIVSRLVTEKIQKEISKSDVVSQEGGESPCW